ncbi:GNAT family N-acetyltransferase [Haloarchaeobius amylolyticus]|uniref:GNAT family N-acetyltransferase n=1 Tax=Haloarchaeobius amylolyticus TaxID=1198296 RepID=UPI002270F19C|nr:GNAT family N-acetyltransferase [Haloarchaeobius amylolyticus]
MDISPATTGDYGRLEETATRSFRASYSLSPRDIDRLTDGFFSATAVEERVESGGGDLFLAEEGVEDPAPDLSGFLELDGEGTLRWLHVHPHARGRGVGTALVEHAQDHLGRQSTPLTARLLDSAREGTQFLEQFGLYPTENESVVVGDSRFDETVYTTQGNSMNTSEPVVAVPDEISVDGWTGRVERDSAVSGTVAPFYPLSDAGGTDRHLGFFCSQCGTTDVTADGNGRLECTECGNTHRADNWDPAYL